MRPPRVLLLVPFVLGLLAALGCTGSRPSGSAHEDGTPAARLDGETLSVADVDAWIKEELFRQATEGGNASKVHELRRQAVDNLINERLLEREAKARGMETDDLLQQEATRRMAVSDAEVQDFWERNKASLGDTPFESVAPQIRSHLERAKAPEAARAFVNELRKGAEIEMLLEVPRFEVAARGPSRGPEDAPVTIVEFSDYQCPFCRRAEPVVEQVLTRYEGKVRFVYRQFPLERIHPLARGASEAALCADDQGRFWDFHSRLFEDGANLEPAGLQTQAEQLGLDLADFLQCVSERRHQRAVQEDVEAGIALGVTGTPAFFINGIALTGAQPLEEFARVIDAELAADGAGADGSGADEAAAATTGEAG